MAARDLDRFETLDTDRFHILQVLHLASNQSQNLLYRSTPTCTLSSQHSSMPSSSHVRDEV